MSTRDERHDHAHVGPYCMNGPKPEPRNVWDDLVMAFEVVKPVPERMIALAHPSTIRDIKRFDSNNESEASKRFDVLVRRAMAGVMDGLEVEVNHGVEPGKLVIMPYEQYMEAKRSIEEGRYRV